MIERDALLEKLRGMTGWPADFAVTPYEAEPCDIAIVGAGHAGIEAALAVSKLGLRAMLFSMNLDSVGNMPCNPSIGGTAKGQLVREIDALGGAIGRLADAAAIQYRMLNATKGRRCVHGHRSIAAWPGVGEAPVGEHRGRAFAPGRNCGRFE